MGLDMYLFAEKYLSGWDHDKPQEQDLFKAALASAGFKPEDVAKGSPHAELKLCVAYWRKANQIHNWFVTHCQDGKDECQYSHVPKEKLLKLRDLCVKAKETHDASLLPPTGGFFFGSTEIDDGYWYDIADTIDQLNKILNNERFHGCEFYYHSSW